MSNRLVEAINAVYDRFVDGAGAPTIPEPVQSDLEAILWNLAGADVDLPVADTGLEGALAELAEHADEIGGGGGFNACTVTVTITGEGKTANVAYETVTEDGYMCGAYDDGTGYIVGLTDPIQYPEGTSTTNFVLLPNKAISLIASQGEVTNTSGSIAYNEDKSTLYEEPVYDVSGDCSITIEGSK